MTTTRPTQLASHDWLGLPIIALWSIVILFLDMFPRGTLFVSIAEATATVYPIVSELIQRFGPLSHVVFCYVLWLPISPLLFLITYYSKSIRSYLINNGASIFRLLGILAITGTLFFTFPPDFSNTSRGLRIANLLYHGKFSSTVISGIATYFITGLLAYIVLTVKSIAAATQKQP